MSDRSEAKLLVDLVTDCRGISSAVLDEHYTLTAIVAQRRRVDSTAQTVVVELIDRGVATGKQRWAAAVHDELRDVASPMSTAPTANQALNRIAWDYLDR
jgi:predicted phosphoribosyltransferase